MKLKVNSVLSFHSYLRKRIFMEGDQEAEFFPFRNVAFGAVVCHPDPLLELRWSFF